MLMAHVYLKLLQSLIKIKSVKGDEVVVIGVTTPETATKTHPKNVQGVTFKDPIPEVLNVVKEIQAKAKATGDDYKTYVILAHLGVDTTTPNEWRGSTLADELSKSPLLKRETCSSNRWSLSYSRINNLWRQCYLQPDRKLSP